MTEDDLIEIASQEGCRVFLVERGPRGVPGAQKIVFPISLPGAPSSEYLDISLTSSELASLQPEDARSRVKERKAALLAQKDTAR